MINGYFDVEAFLAALNQVREERQLSWYGIYRETGVYGVAETAQRQSWCQQHNGRNARAMSVHTMAVLALWAGLDIQQFLRQEREELSSEERLERQAQDHLEAAARHRDDPMF